MDPSRFDAALRLLANSAGRRATLHALGVAAVAAFTGLGLGDASAQKSGKGLPPVDSDAKRRGKAKKKKKRKSPTTPVVSVCDAACKNAPGC